MAGTWRTVLDLDEETGITPECLTNARDISAETVARCHKEGRRIELFCRWIKQNLRV